MNDTTDILLNIDMVREHGKDFIIFIYRLISGEVHVEMKDSMYYYTHLDAVSNRTLGSIQMSILTIMSMRDQLRLYLLQYSIA